jgi:hypothetical protein
MDTKKKISVRFKLMRPKANSSSIVVKVQAGFLFEKYDKIIQTFDKRGKPEMPEYHSTFRRFEKPKYETIQIATGLTIPPPFFQTKEQTCIGNFDHYNDILKAMKQTIIMVYNSLNEVTPELLKDEIKKRIINRDEKKDKLELPVIKEEGIALFTDYLKAKIDEHRKMKSRQPATLIGYNKFRNYILKFEMDALEGKKIRMDAINTKILKTAIIWFTDLINPKTERNYSLNYLDWFKRTWKLFLNEAQIEDEIEFENLNIEKGFMKRKNEDADDIYLTFTELKQIKDLKFEDEEKILEQIRDSFIVQCSHGQRWQDHKHIQSIFREEKEKEKYYFHISRTIKNKTFNVKIPVLDETVINIFIKYGCKFPLMGNGSSITISDQYYNEQLKVIGMRAKLDAMHYPTQTDSNGKIVRFKGIAKKYLLTSKVGRKTAISNWIREYSIPLPIAMSWSNHQSESSFRVYCKIEPDEYYEMANKLMDDLKKTRDKPKTNS